MTPVFLPRRTKFAKQFTDRHLRFTKKFLRFHEPMLLTRPLCSNSKPLIHECWKCGTDLDPVGQQYFCDCGVVQPPKLCRDFFCMMGMKVDFDVNVPDLKKQFTTLQRNLHPDKFTQKSETEKEFSLQQSSTVNKAYSTLLKPLSRALYMLELKGIFIEESNISAEPKFLMEILEINEELAEADSLEAVEDIRTTNQKVMDDITASLSVAFRNGDLEEAKILISKLKYYANIEDKVKELRQLYAHNL
ncbi:hypothetical protein CAPTEDRAFT_162651 [Capitella teleta]|uniref:J domain-containing protein n=1 Tax=Capitella teleta TaxID=283909 RepID=R7TY63_CAPTE|nr:hypothetical protein CAPTEDRAFT_162651 [Capitella teleta]|eukprot:ELT96361.1 hypothetical protein CAPTEDRAFT_162651 [Capitella teleta]